MNWQFTNQNSIIDEAEFVNRDDELYGKIDKKTGKYILSDDDFKAIFESFGQLNVNRTLYLLQQKSGRQLDTLKVPKMQ